MQARPVPKNFFLALILASVLAAACWCAPPTAATVPVLDRIAPAELEALERELAAELLVLNLRILHLQEDHMQIERKLVELADSCAAEEEKLTAAQERLKETRRRLGQWVRYLYEDGRLPLVGLLLQAQGLADFLRRLDFVRLLIEHEYRLLNEVQTLNAAIQERLRHLAALRAETRLAESRIASQLAELEEVQDRRTAFLEKVRGRSAHLADRLANLERQWQESLVPLNNLLGQLNIALVRDLQPDRVYFQGRHMLVEVSAATINRALRTAAGDTEGSLRVGVTAEGITVTSVDRAGRTGFVIAGRLVPVSGGEAVVFQAEKVMIDGLELDAGLLPFLAADQGTFSLGSSLQFMTIAEITHEKDRIRFALRRN